MVSVTSICCKSQYAIVIAPITPGKNELSKDIQVDKNASFVQLGRETQRQAREASGKVAS